MSELFGVSNEFNIDIASFDRGYIIPKPSSVLPEFSTTKNSLKRNPLSERRTEGSTFLIHKNHYYSAQSLERYESLMSFHGFEPWEFADTRNKANIDLTLTFMEDLLSQGSLTTHESWKNYVDFNRKHESTFHKKNSTLFKTNDPLERIIRFISNSKLYDQNTSYSMDSIVNLGNDNRGFVIKIIPEKHVTDRFSREFDSYKQFYENFLPLYFTSILEKRASAQVIEGFSVRNHQCTVLLSQ
jgi:hypothetical protein